MELLLIEPKESSILRFFELYGSVPMMKGSKILLFLFDGRPVLGSILTKLIPEGILKGILFQFIFAFFINFLKIGKATEEPVSL